MDSLHELHVMYLENHLMDSTKFYAIGCTHGLT